MKCYAAASPKPANSRLSRETQSVGPKTMAASITPGPHTPELRRLSREADVFAVTSRAEAFGIAHLEAIAPGLPVIAVNSCGIRDTVLPGSTSWIVRPEERATCRSLATLRWRTGQQLAALGQAGWKRAETPHK